MTYFDVYTLFVNSDCGGFVENKGGAITMMHMVEEFEPDVLFDCIWLFRTSQRYNHFKSQHLYMKVIKLNNLGKQIRIQLPI